MFRANRNSAVIHLIETPAIARAVELESRMLGDFLKMRVDGIKPGSVVDGDDGDEDAEPDG